MLSINLFSRLYTSRKGIRSLQFIFLSLVQGVSKRGLDMKFIRKILYNLIKKDIEFQILGRIAAFHDILVKRGQIKPTPKQGPVEEN